MLLTILYYVEALVYPTFVDIGHSSAPFNPPLAIILLWEHHLPANPENTRR